MADARDSIVLVGGPLHGLMTAKGHRSQSMSFPVQAAPNAHGSATYDVVQVHPDYEIGIFKTGVIRDPEITEESGILCAHCGRDPATGEEVDEDDASLLEA